VEANARRRGKPQTVELARKAGRAGLGVAKSEQMRAALSEARKGRPLTEEHRRSLSVAHQRWWATATDEQRASRPYPRGPWNKRDTSIEVAVAAVLEELGEPYESQRRMDRWVPDFVIEPRKLVIECDGSYWHSLPAAIDRDRRKDEWMVVNGYRIVRLTEDEIRADSRSAVIAALCNEQP
jgi:very-short-patch-repair endonuclease